MMKFGGWGDPGKVYDLASRPNLWPFVQAQVGLDDRIVSPPRPAADVSLPPSHLPPALQAALTAALADEEEAAAAAAAARIAEVEAELREHAAATARAAALRDRRLPGLQGALEAVRAELYADSPDEFTDARKRNSGRTDGH